MDEKKIEDEFSQWFSTYELVTAERILNRYQIVVPQAQLLAAIKSPISFYHKLIQVPIKNVLNGIILQQANDYHIYVQKLFIDYLLSGESGKPPEAQGAFTRESLEEERKQLITVGEEFQEQQIAHDSLIASTQSTLIKLSKEWNQCFEAVINSLNKLLAFANQPKSLVRQAVVHALINCEIKENATNVTELFVENINEIIKISLTEVVRQQIIESCSPLIDIIAIMNEKIEHLFLRNKEISDQLRSFREQFYTTILRVIDLINLLPEYKLDPDQDAINREPLHFDKSIGEHVQ